MLINGQKKLIFICEDNYQSSEKPDGSSDGHQYAKKLDDYSVKYGLRKAGKKIDSDQTIALDQIAEANKIIEPTGSLADADPNQPIIPEQLIKSGTKEKEKKTIKKAIGKASKGIVKIAKADQIDPKQPAKPGELADIGTKGKEKKKDNVKVFNVIDDVGEDEDDIEEEDSSSDYVYESGSEESSARQSEIDEAKQELPDLFDE